MTGSRDDSNNAAQSLAERCAQTMWAGDERASALGMRLGRVGPGRAEVSLVVREDMLTHFGMIHGGVVFTLADTAFSLACNSRNMTSFAMSCSIDFVRPAVTGDELTARASEQSHTSSSGFFEITVSNQHGKAVAHFRGRSFTRGEPLLDDPEVQ